MLDSEEKAKILFKALRHVYSRQDFSDNPADGYTRKVKQKGTTWTIYDAHDDIPALGYTVTTDGQGKVISVSDSFVMPEDKSLRIQPRGMGSEPFIIKGR